MAVKLNFGGGGLFPLTSPPALPDPIPAGEMFPKVIDYGDRKVWVSHPFPDKLALTCTLLHQHQAQYGSPSATPKDYEQLDAFIMGHLDEVALADVDFVSMGAQVKSPTRRSATFKIQYNLANPLDLAFFKLTRSVKDGIAAWKVDLDFCPSKAGPAGLERIREGVHETGLQLELLHMLPDMEVARLDAAIDCIGVEPLDLIPHAPKVGKRIVYIGDHGRPETVYLFEKKKHFAEPPKKMGVRTHGPQRLTLYERRDYHLQMGLPPPYGPAPVTRAEVVRRWGKGRPPFAALSSADNLFEGRRVAYAAAVTDQHRKAWRSFCLEVFGGGLEKTEMRWLTKGGPKFAALYRDCAGDLVSAEAWAGWGHGLAWTGLTQWLEVANIKAVA